jgi:hypothetical protein
LRRARATLQQSICACWAGNTPTQCRANIKRLLAQAFQDRFSILAGSGLSQAEIAQQLFAPLGQAGQGLFRLGQGYLAESPQQAAQRFMAEQQELLAPSRERQLAQLQQGLFNTGRGGLSVGATGMRPSGAMGLSAASPEVEAYYNALAQQDALLATQATQGGMDQARFGAGLFATGGNLLTQGLQGQVTALGPYEAYLEQIKQIEGLGQQSVDQGVNIGSKGQSAASAQALLSGGTSAAQSRFAANAYNPFATALIQGSQNPQFTNALGKYFTSSQTGPFVDYGGYGQAGSDALRQYGII